MAYSPSTASANAVEGKIHNLLWELDPVRTHGYISSRDATLKAHTAVAIAAVLAYLQAGDFGLAAAAIDATDFHEIIKEDRWIFQEDIACLALLSATIESHRNFQFKRLVPLLTDVDNVYINCCEPSLQSL